MSGKRNKLLRQWAKQKNVRDPRLVTSAKKVYKESTRQQKREMREELEQTLAQIQKRI